MASHDPAIVQKLLGSWMPEGYAELAHAAEPLPHTYPLYPRESFAVLLTASELVPKQQRLDLVPAPASFNQFIAACQQQTGINGTVDVHVYEQVSGSYQRVRDIVELRAADLTPNDSSQVRLKVQLRQHATKLSDGVEGHVFTARTQPQREADHQRQQSVSVNGGSSNNSRSSGPRGGGTYAFGAWEQTSVQEEPRQQLELSIEAETEPVLATMQNERAGHCHVHSVVGAGQGKMVVCPYLFEGWDAMLTWSCSGSPTLLFRAAQGSIIAWAWSCMAGTAVTPGVWDAKNAHDPLLALALASAFVSNAVVIPLLLEEVRVTISGTAGGGKLLQLGAGTEMIPADRAHNLQLPHLTKSYWGLVVCVTACYGPAIYTGLGLQSTMHNRLAAAAALLACVTAAPIVGLGYAALATASALIGARIQGITQAVMAEAETTAQDVNPQDWERTVLGPCRLMIHDMRLLSEGWSRFVLLGWMNCWLTWCVFTCAWLSTHVADLLGTTGNKVGMPWLIYLFHGCCLFGAGYYAPYRALEIAAGPAQVRPGPGTFPVTDSVQPMLA